MWWRSWPTSCLIEAGKDRLGLSFRSASVKINWIELRFAHARGDNKRTLGCSEGGSALALVFASLALHLNSKPQPSQGQLLETIRWNQPHSARRS